MNEKSWLSRIPFHHILWGIVPLLIYLNVNISQVTLDAVWRPLVISLLFSLLVFGVILLFLRDLRKAALLSSLLLFLFFTYGHVYTLLKEVTIFNVFVGRHRFMFPLWCLILAIGVFSILKKIGSFGAWTMILNIVMLFLTIVQCLQIGIHYYNRSRTEVQAQSQIQLGYDDPQPMPDIYIIILDAYGRDDLLLDRYGFDNSNFINALEDTGFTFVPCARSNYQQTVLSIPSLLNMGYIHDLVGDEVTSHTVRYVHVNNHVRRSLEDIGYRYVTYDSEFPWLEIEDSDVFFDFGTITRFSFLQPFEVNFLETTWGLVLADWLSIRTQHLLESLNLEPVNALKATRELANLNALDQTIGIEGPKLVYAHFMITHSPFFFDEEGNILDSADLSGSAYIDSIKFMNSQILPIINKIMDQADGDVIIVLQSDHSYEYDNRWLILNAIYFPEARGDLVLYPGMTPVNTFRLIFNEAYGTNLPLLEDQHYESANDWFTHWPVEIPDPYCSVGLP